MHNLHEALLRKSIVVVTGAAGTGKTAAVLEYAYRHANSYQRVIWIDARTHELFLAAALELAEEFSLPVATARDAQDIFQTIQNWLFEQPDTLFIIDNLAPSRQTEQNLVPRRVRGHLILITREAQLSEAFSCLYLDSLDECDGALLLLCRAGLLETGRTLDQASEELRASALELADTLRREPLPLNLAGAYLRVNPCPFEDYLALYHRFPLSLKLLAGANERPLEASYGCTAASLEAPAQTLLHLCAFLAPDAIPSALFYQAVVLRELWPASPVVDASSVDTLIERLQACGLITRSHRPDMLAMPSLLQTVVRQRLPLDQQQQYVELALRAFHALLCAAEAEMLAERLRLAGHIRQLSASGEEWTISFSEAASVFNWAGSLLWEQGLLREAEPLLNRGLTIWERVLGSTHPLVATLSLNLAVINMQLERYTSAESLARRAITAKAHAPGATHADVLLALNNLGRIYAHQKKYSSAKLCYEKALAIGKHGKLEAHPTCVASLYDLAMLEIEQEHFTSAEPLLRQVCTIWERATESERPQRLQAWQSLAEISMRLGKWKQARKYFLRLLPVYRQELGEQHAATQHCLEQLAQACIQRERFAEARDYLQRLLRIREQGEDPAQPGIAACLSSLADIHLYLEEYAPAQPLLERARSIYERQPEPDGAALAAVLEKQATIHIVQEDHVQAIACLEKALFLREQSQGADHLDLVECLSSLGMLYLQQIRMDEAEPLLLRALALYQHAQKPEDLALDAVLENLALIALSRQRYEQARMYLDRQRGVRSQFFGADAPETARVFQRLAHVALAQEEWPAAEQCYRRALTIYESAHGSAHPITLACLEELAALHVRQGKLDEAETIARNVLTIAEQTSGPRHPDLVSKLLTLGQICLARQRFAEAEASLRRALDLFQHIPEAPLFLHVLLLSALATALAGQGHQEQGRALEEQARMLLNAAELSV